MKKGIVAVVMATLLLVGCGGSKLSEAVQQYGNQAVKAIEDYQAGTITAAEASDIVSSCSEKVSAMDLSYIEDSTFSMTLISASSRLLIIEINESHGESTKEDIEELDEILKKLKEKL